MLDVESDPKEGLFHCALLWGEDDLNELIHWCDASMSFIRKYGPAHQATTNSNNFNPTMVGGF